MKHQFNRREFLGSVGALGAISLLPVSLRAAGKVEVPPSAGLLLTAENGAIGIRLPGAPGGGLLHLEALIEGFAPAGPPQVSPTETRQQWTSPSGEQHCEVIQRFKAAPSGPIAWTISLSTKGPPTSAPIHLIAHYPGTDSTRFWTAWSDASQPSGGLPAREEMKQWADPLRAMPLASRHFLYGAPAYTHDDPGLSFWPNSRDLIALPLASFLEPSSDTGISLVLSPDAPTSLLDLSLQTDSAGTADFTLLNHRFQPRHPLEFEVTIVAHEADWRGGVRWMTQKYPRYFSPTLPLADDLDGTAAYSSDTTLQVDADKLKKMAFRTNWKASFDFPYMGMFLPPVAEGASWNRYITDDTGLRKPGTQLTSVRQMAEYSEQMRAKGFYVLNYFNVTEFGSDILYPAPPRQEHDRKTLWHNANDFLYTEFPGAILSVPAGLNAKYFGPKSKLRVGGPFYTWGNGIAMDCGEKPYAHFLLEQVKADLKKLPASSGVCIDRMDWLRFYNENRDDGVTWFNGKPARSLLNSWRGFIPELLRLFHGDGKVVFVNNHTKRFDLLQDVDGIYDEFSVSPASLNLTGFLCIQRPALGWTNDEKAIRPDPDGFFQRFLYMGVFPTAPFPGNDHALPPSPWADQQYLDYGPLMNAIHGRKWVLTPHAVSVPGGEANANIFAVGGGYAIPVTHGGTQTHAKVSVANLGLKQVTAEALLPGQAEPVAVTFTAEGDRWVADIPLARGCAMVRMH